MRIALVWHDTMIIVLSWYVMSIPSSMYNQNEWTNGTWLSALLHHKSNNNSPNYYDHHVRSYYTLPRHFCWFLSTSLLDIIMMFFLAKCCPCPSTLHIIQPTKLISRLTFTQKSGGSISNIITRQDKAAMKTTFVRCEKPSHSKKKWTASLIWSWRSSDEHEN